MFPSRTLAVQLKEAGLSWQPRLHDFFIILDRALDDRVFVLSDMMVDMEVLHGYPALTFVGSVEWALDYILQTEAVWLPTEAQLRHQLQVQLAHVPQPSVTLVCYSDRYVCVVGGVENAGITAADAYAQALLHRLPKNID